MAFFNAANYQTPMDPETGCSGEPAVLEACRQAYYLKQQNQILRQGNESAGAEVKSENAELKSQLDTLNQRIANQDAQNQRLRTLLMTSMQQEQPINESILTVGLPALFLISGMLLGVVIHRSVARAGMQRRTR